MGPENTLHSKWDYVSAPLPWWKGEEPLQATFNFQNRLLGWEGPGATLHRGYELILLPMHSMGIIHISPGFVLEVISSAHSPLGSSVIGLHCFQELSLALLVRWGQKTLFTEVGLWFTSLFGHGQTRLYWLYWGKTPHLDSNQADLHPTKFPGNSSPQPGSADEQSLWLGLLLGHFRYKLCLPRSMCWLLQTLPVLDHRLPCNPHDERS